MTANDQLSCGVAGQYTHGLGQFESCSDTETVWKLSEDNVSSTARGDSQTGLGFLILIIERPSPCRDML